MPAYHIGLVEGFYQTARLINFSRYIINLSSSMSSIVCRRCLRMKGANLAKRKAYRICDPKDFSNTESRDVKFLEDKKGAALLDNDNTTKTQDYSLIEIFENDNSEETFPLQDPEDVAKSQEESFISPNQTSPRYNLRPNVRDQIYHELSSDEEPIFDNEDKDPTYEPDEEAFKVSHGDLLPSSYEEAISNPDSTLWRQAMNKEIHYLKDHHIWNLIELPQDAKPIKSKKMRIFNEN
ncbi:hypothetical protein LAZ67_23001001 [Cordylochernes scorpioides]|uniref:Uncharacterized protein n=1 Tax=Cordylochernes scorpioides TaxID=51811 RepID=A0ABY6LTG1_9ARAC|nr:hypothetical protein LAZ67_23001001 [Cordylochernes scorpioides]